MQAETEMISLGPRESEYPRARVVAHISVVSHRSRDAPDMCELTRLEKVTSRQSVTENKPDIGIPSLHK